YRWVEGLLRRARTVPRSAAPPAAGFSGSDRRGRPLLRGAGERRRWRYPALGPHRDRNFRFRTFIAEGRRPRGGAQALGHRISSRRTAVRRAEPGAGEILAVAHRPD